MIADKEGIQIQPLEVGLSDDIQINLKRSRRKTLSLEVSNNGVLVRAPLRLSLKDIKAFIIQKQHWLARKLAERPAPKKPIKFQTGEQLSLLGNDITLTIDPNTRQVNLVGDQLLVPMTNADLCKSKLTKWYKQQLLELLEIKVQSYANQLNVRTNQIKVREYKRRWGSCDTNANLSFNWRIIMAPEPVINYIVVHELAHIIEFNHSKHFWAIVSAVIPQWREQKKWLNSNGANLYLF